MFPSRLTSKFAILGFNWTAKSLETLDFFLVGSLNFHYLTNYLQDDSPAYNYTSLGACEGLWPILDAPWLVSNQTIHIGLNISFISYQNKSRFKLFHFKLSTHSNSRVQALPPQPFETPVGKRTIAKWTIVKTRQRKLLGVICSVTPRDFAHC